VSSNKVLLLPLSHLAAEGPWLIIGHPNNPLIELDSRRLDAVRSSRVAGLTNSELILALDDIEVALHVADGQKAVRRLANHLGPYARKARITRRDVYRDAKARLHAMMRTGPTSDETLKVREARVYVQGDRLKIGTGLFRIADVRRYARSGGNLPLAEGGLLQAALALLVVIANEPRNINEDLRQLEKRIADYDKRQRR
jgi:hypothetical protein